MNKMNDRTEKLACMKRLRDVLNEAIAALETGREVKVEEKLFYGREWFEVIEFAQRDYRCVIKPREVWVNEYPAGGRIFYDSRDIADTCARDSRIRCTRYVEAPNDD